MTKKRKKERKRTNKRKNEIKMRTVKKDDN